MYLTNKTTITFNLPDEYEAQNNFIKTQDMSKWAVHEGSRGITYVYEDRYIADMQKGEPMSDLIPYKVIMGRVKDDIDFIAEQAYERGRREVFEQLSPTSPEKLTDKEQRIFLAAMGREEKICEEVDRNYVREPYEDSLVRVCKEIKRKIRGALWT